MPQAAPLDKKVKTEWSTTKSFLLESIFGKGDASCEATEHQAGKTRTAKPKGIVLFIAVFQPFSAPHPKLRNILVWDQQWLTVQVKLLFVLNFRGNY